MTKKSNKTKSDQLGMPHGTASAKLRKAVMFSLVQKTGMDICHRCGEKIKDIKDLSIEHKIPWLHSEDPVQLFFDLENIAFSHLKCNIASARKPLKGKICGDHGGRKMYDKHKCRCDVCKESRKIRSRVYRKQLKDKV